MVNNLVCNLAVVLQDVEILCAAEFGDPLRDGLFRTGSVSISYHTHHPILSVLLHRTFGTGSTCGDHQVPKSCLSLISQGPPGD